MRRLVALTGFVLLLASQMALSQEPPAGMASTPLGQQFPAMLPPGGQYSEAPSPALPPYLPPNPHAESSLGDQFQAPPAQDQFEPSPSASVAPMQLPPEGAPVPTPETAIVPKIEPPPKIWEGGLELGLNGSEGNSQVFNLHFGAKLKRKTEFNILSSELDYRKNNADGIETANKAFLESRFEHLFQQSRWTWFVHNIVDYDEFKAYDLRVSLDTGVGYQLIKNDVSSLIGRVGGGTTREIGGPDDRFIPETVFGLEGEHKLSARQKLCASIEYRPDVTDFGDYRLNAKADWEVLLDEEKHLSMKIGVLDRYDSYADGLKPNDIDYTLALLWSF